MIDDRENNEYADGHEDAPAGEAGKTEAPYEDGLDDVLVTGEAGKRVLGKTGKLEQLELPAAGRCRS